MKKHLIFHKRYDMMYLSISCGLALNRAIGFLVGA